MASKRIYTRANLDLDPPEAVENPEKILRQSNSKVEKETYHLHKSTSLPAEGVESIDEMAYDLKFEHSLFRAKSESHLDHIIFYPKHLVPITPKTFSKYSTKDQKLFWDTLSPDLKKELLIESPIHSKFSIFFVKSKFESISQPLFSVNSPIKGNKTLVASPSFHLVPVIHIPTTFVPLCQTLTPNLSLAMAARFAPLVLPT